MDVDSWIFLTLLCLVVFFLTSGLLFCTRRQRGNSRSSTCKAPVVVTSATHTAPGGYPVTQQVPPQGTIYAANVYSPSYPPPQSNATMTMPMPQPSYQAAPGVGGFPQMPMPQPIQQQQMNPPPYDVAVATGGFPMDRNQAVNEPYGKQAPYNPNYNP